MIERDNQGTYTQRRTYSVSPIKGYITIGIFFDVIANDGDENNIDEKNDGGEESGQSSDDKSQQGRKAGGTVGASAEHEERYEHCEKSQSASYGMQDQGSGGSLADDSDELIGV
ncbi:hypothetical protein D9757_002009 [Collybiopsis confluens]|uniref:Uncharacterized protein n=1 Tax=Collybiopsis confluens TaxID=2823264 RepID=A0A8H5MEV1_9AGAR|nr:hypothetical protein D9757_002009 [Collybiopsis confluens]